MPIDASVYGAIQPPKFNDPFSQLGQMFALRQQQEQHGANIAATQALEQQRRQATETAQQKQYQNTVLAEVYGESFDPQSGTVNRQKLSQGLATRGLGQLAPSVLKAIDEAEKARADAQAAKRKADEAEYGYAGTLAKQIFAADFNPAVVKGIFALAKSHDYDTSQYEQLFTERPDEFKAFVTNLAQPKDAPKPFSLGPGQTQFGPDGKPIASVPANPPAASFQSKDVLLDGQPSMVNFDSRSGKYFQGDQDVTARVRPIPPRAPQDDRIVQVMGPEGTPIWERESNAVGKPAAQAARAVTGAERQALAFFNRAKDAVETITPLETEIAGMGLGGQARLQYAPNVAQTQTGQSYRQAQRSFTEARLRKESGAAIPSHEYENDAKTYFAQPGDTADTIAQKQKARQTVLEGLGYAAGKAYDEFYGEPMKKSSGSASTKPQKPIPGIPGGVAEQQSDGRWIRVK